MILAADIFLWFCLGCVTVQDLRAREISWCLIPLLLAGFFLRGGILLPEISVLFKYFLVNLGFVVLQLVVLSVIISIKNKRVVNIINTYLGLGDILFFVVLCGAFSPLNFITFYVGSIILTLISIIVYNKITSTKVREIPLAGSLSLAMGISTFISVLNSPVNLLNDSFILHFISLI
jgi:hypothetical protein